MTTIPDIEVERAQFSLPPTYAPSLVFSHGDKCQEQTFCTLFDGGCHVRSIPEMRGTYCLASCYGWLILQIIDSTECYLFNPVSLVKIGLPPILHSSFHIGALTSSASDPNCFAVIYSAIKKSIIFCRIGDTEWIEQELERKDTSSELIQSYTISSVSCNGKVFLLFHNCIVAIDVHDGFVASVELYEQKIPDLGCVRYRDCLVESCGEIFRVRLMRLGESSHIIRKCDVFKLDFSTMEWARVQNICGRIFLLANIGSSSISANELVGVKGNRIYLSFTRGFVIYMFDMDDGTVTTTLPSPEVFPNRGINFWLVPDCKVELTRGVVNFKESKSEIMNKDKSWINNVPIELLELILSFLSLGDCVRFRLASKSWIPITSPIKSNTPPLQTECRQPHQLPWLVSLPNLTKGICNIYHPIFGDVYTINNPELEGAVFCNAKYGWLLMTREDKFIFFLNPLTQEIIKLPDLPYLNDLTGLTFSSPPTSPDCMVFGIDNTCTMKIYSKSNYHGDEDNEDNEGENEDNEGENEDNESDNEGDSGGEGGEWYTYTPKNKQKDFEFKAADCNPVFSNGVFYCLSRNGKLGIFDPKAEDDDHVWLVLDVAPIFTKSSIDDFGTSLKSYLVEDNGDIVSLFVDFSGNPVWVYKLDQSEEKNLKWVKLDDLGNKSLFVSIAASMQIPMNLNGTENRIYFPQFHEENCTFYSLSTGRYQCFKCVYCNEDCKAIREHGNCTWMQLKN